MIKSNPDAFKKQFCLTAVGVTLQVIGNVCLFAATLSAIKEINSQIKQVLIQELSR